MNLRNANFKKDWKSTVLSIVGGLLIIAGMVWPDKIDAETQASVNNAVVQIVTGLGGLIAVISGLFSQG